MKIKPSEAFEQFRTAGISFFTGVPDSLLKSFCAYASDELSSDEHIIAANEGSSIAIASGHYLATSKPSLVYMQNSGIGNAVNPLLSLASPEVYSIPMIVMIGWRGEPDRKDEPQHMLQGQIMPQFLNSMNIPWFELSPKTKDSGKVIQEAIAGMTKSSCPVVILVKKNTFEDYNSKNLTPSLNLLSREAAIQILAKNLNSNDLIVSTTGMASRELYEYRQSSGGILGEDFLTVGSMGHASSIAAGIALGRPEKKVICIDGDGALLMHMGAVGVIGQSNLPNFIHIVLNNGAHDSVGGQPTVGLDINLPKIAKACGYKVTSSVSEERDIIDELLRMNGEKGPSFLEVIIGKGSRPNLGRPISTPLENKQSFMKKVEEGN
ncbi:MAG: phosphonopyruvate decarboxylase [Verrucomicrobiota bacterium]|nr:phosphonopyruvate decarboxylase [Verrucomicrobiota bacterium]